LTVSKDTAVSSISGVYLAAFLVENEIQDLFGIHFEGLVIDYDRTLYLDEEVTVIPFCKYTLTESPNEVDPSTPESDAMSKSEEL
jgi:NADH:ubiquinone oxidoreductase subunit C